VVIDVYCLHSRIPSEILDVLSFHSISKEPGAKPMAAAVYGKPILGLTAVWCMQPNSRRMFDDKFINSISSKSAPSLVEKQCYCPLVDPVFSTDHPSLQSASAFIIEKDIEICSLLCWFEMNALFHPVNVSDINIA
jgi:hypothetical protein